MMIRSTIPIIINSQQVNIDTAESNEISFLHVRERHLENSNEFFLDLNSKTKERMFSSYDSCSCEVFILTHSKTKALT